MWGCIILKWMMYVIFDAFFAWSPCPDRLLRSPSESITLGETGCSVNVTAHLRQVETLWERMGICPHAVQTRNLGTKTTLFWDSSYIGMIWRWACKFDFADVVTSIPDTATSLKDNRQYSETLKKGVRIRASHIRKCRGFYAVRFHCWRWTYIILKVLAQTS
jgi:hypothetical protein